MRYFYIQSGKYKGEYPIYEGEKEFKKENPDLDYKRWGREEHPSLIEIGDFVEAMDGYIVECLNRYILGGNNYAFRFPMATCSCVLKKKGGIRWYNFYAQFAVPNKNSLSGKNYGSMRGEGFTRRKMLFGQLVGAGLNVFDAYKQAGYPFTLTPDRQVNKIRELLMDKEVQKYMVRQSGQEMLERIRNDEEFKEEVIIKYVKDFMNSVKKGSQLHLDSIPSLFILLGIVPPDYFEPKLPTRGRPKSNKDVEDVDFETVPPP